MPAKLFAAVLAVFIMAGGPAFAQTLVIPTPDEAKGALLRMFGNAPPAMAAAQVKIGTCKAVSKPQHDGEVACSLAMTMGAGSSETQANFYRAAGRWTATPTEEDLPFPDPKLR